MAKKVYASVNGVARKVKKIYAGVFVAGDTEKVSSHEVKKGYIGVDGVARQFFTGETTWQKYSSTSYTAYESQVTTDGSGTYSLNSTFYVLQPRDNPSYDEYSGIWTSIGSAKRTSASSYRGYYVNNSRSDRGSYKYMSSFNSSNNRYTSTKRIQLEQVTKYRQGSYIGDVTSPDENAYPENGRHTDGYWYVKLA